MRDDRRQSYFAAIWRDLHRFLYDLKDVLQIAGVAIHRHIHSSRHTCNFVTARELKWGVRPMLVLFESTPGAMGPNPEDALQYDVLIASPRLPV